jgi:hypothetical protein
MKRLFSIFIVLVIMTSLPIYGATRILFPKWLKDQIESKLPEGSILEIGLIKSGADLSILYKNVKYSYGDIQIIFPNLIFEPRLSLENPVVLNTQEMRVVFKNNLVLLTDVKIGVFPNSLSLKDLKLEGSLGELSKENSMFIENVSFLISEIGKKKLDFKISAEQMSSNVGVPLGSVKLNMSNLEASITVDDGLRADIRSNFIDFLFTDRELKDVKRTLSGNNFLANLDFEKRNTWSVPISFVVRNVVSAQGELAETMDFSAIAAWDDKSISCNFKDIIQFLDSCGKLINVLNVSMLIDSPEGKLEFTGDGLCVAPNSGCTQMINSDIRSTNTSLMFSNIMKSGFVNPLVGGIILGSLLSSPTNTQAGFEHQVNFKVLGSKILLNDTPLIK